MLDELVLHYVCQNLIHVRVNHIRQGETSKARVEDE